MWRKVSLKQMEQSYSYLTLTLLQIQVNGKLHSHYPIPIRYFPLCFPEVRFYRNDKCLYGITNDLSEVRTSFIYGWKSTQCT